MYEIWKSTEDFTEAIWACSILPSIYARLGKRPRDAWNTVSSHLFPNPEDKRGSHEVAEAGGTSSHVTLAHTLHFSALGSHESPLIFIWYQSTSWTGSGAPTKRSRSKCQSSVAGRWLGWYHSRLHGRLGGGKALRAEAQHHLFRLDLPKLHTIDTWQQVSLPGLMLLSQ